MTKQPTDATLPTQAMVAAGLAAWDRVCAAMALRSGSDTPEDLPDYDEGDVCSAIYLAMQAAAPTPNGEGVARPVVVERAADAWDAHCLAVERCNAAIPDLEATKAEREVYDERYRASEQAKRDMYAAAFDLAKWASQNRAALEAVRAGDGR